MSATCGSVSVFVNSSVSPDSKVAVHQTHPLCESMRQHWFNMGCFLLKKISLGNVLEIKYVRNCEIRRGHNMKADDRIASAVLHTTALRYAVYPAYPRPPLEPAARVTLLDQHSTGLCWLFCGVALLEPAYRAEHPDAASHPYVPDITRMYRAHLKGCVQAFFVHLSDAKRCRTATLAILDRAIVDGGSFGMFRSIVARDGMRMLAEPPRLPRSVVQTRQMLAYLSHIVRRGAAASGDKEAAVRAAYCVIDRCLGPESSPSGAVWRPSLDAYQVDVNAPHPYHGWISSFWHNDPSVRQQDLAHVTNDERHIVDICLRELASRRPIWATFHVGLDFDAANGVAGAEASGVLPVLPATDRAVRMSATCRDISPNHAMLIVGRNADTLHWMLHNSWGTRKPRDLHTANDTCSQLICVTDAWFRTNVFHVAHCPHHLTPMTPPVRLAPYDALSTVARGARQPS